MPTAAPRLPGLRFETARPPTPPGLPRMDVAAFVGFASAGPVGVPVAVDDEVRFTDIYGADLPLAWDRERGETAHAHLAPGVREFFRNGGRRCWIVRVADEASAETSVFRLPGMLRGIGDQLDAAYLLASSPGSWADGMALNAALLGTFVAPGEVVAEGAGVRLAVESTDLLRLEWPDGTVAFFPPQATPTDRDLAPEERREAETRLFAHAYWFRAVKPADLVAPAASPVFLFGPRETPLPGDGWAIGGDGALEIPLAADAVRELQPGCWIRAGDAYLLVDEVEREQEETRVRVRQGWRALPPGSVAVLDAGYRASLLSLELWTRQADGSVARTPETGLVPAHPRFLGAFPPDEVRFAPTERLVESALDPARSGTAAGRVPLASFDPGVHTLREDGTVGILPRDAALRGGVVEPTSWPFQAYLPLGVPSIAREDFYQGAQASERDPLERNGLGTFSAALFLDDLLASRSTETLLDEAFYNAHVAEPPLPPSRMHALLGVEEVSILAIPDAVQSGWRRRETVEDQPPAPPASPFISLPIDEPVDGQTVVSWTPVALARGYTLEYSTDPRFRSGMLSIRTTVTPDLPGTSAAVVDRELCRERMYFRVRARTDGGQSAWSPTALRGPAEHAFGVCGVTPLAAPAITSVEPSGERLALRWAAAPEDAETEQTRAPYERVFRVESSPEPTFSIPELVYEGTARKAEVWKPVSGSVYFRVASWLRERRLADDPAPARIVEESPWSVPSSFGIEPPRRWEMIPASDADATTARDVQLAMLRFCAARSDCTAVLTLPRHYREADALAHAALLTSALGGGSAEPGDEGARALSFGALYHPWTVVRAATSGASLRVIPPDGATCGVMAARTNEMGAWVAPANAPLSGVAVLEPKLPEAVRALWQGRKVNALAPFPRGFMTWSEETLSDDPDLRGVGVRRLLILLRRLALREGNTYVFEPNNEAFRRLVQRQFDALLGDLFVRGAFAGTTHADGYRVVTDVSVNPFESVDQGRLIVELRVAPSRPLAFLTVRLVQTGAGLTIQES